MNRYSASIRLSIGLASLAATVLLLAETLGLLPDPRVKVLEGRAALCETLAVNGALLSKRGEIAKIEAMLQAISQRNPDIISAGLRDDSGRLLVNVGEHANHWRSGAKDARDGAQVSVPILADDRRWGTIEVRFRSLTPAGFLAWLRSPLTKLLAFVLTASVVFYYFYLRRMLQHLDPSNVIPDRVRTTLDTLAEGLLVLDLNGRIILANQAFARNVGLTPDELQGSRAENLPWTKRGDEQQPTDEFPWKRSIQAGSATTGIMLGLSSAIADKTFMVNSAPIMSDDGKCRGALASFGDVTLLEQSKADLLRMLETLKESREEIHRQNEELQLLATRDPLTGCLNRRAFFGQFETHWAASLRYGHPLSCIMVDVDHFKSVNDRFGHGVGDQVLQKIGAILKSSVREGDLVCRYGGEEFCILMPHLDIDGARRAAERYRKTIEASKFPEFTITASLGVSSMSCDPRDTKDFIDKADKALYLAKRSGRNCVVCWDQVPPDMVVDESKVRQVVPPDAAESRVPFQAVTALLSALSYRDSATAEHSRRVADLCVATAGGRMSASDAYVLEVAALLHDIGKIGVPDSILLKPGPLTTDEWRVMRVHDRIGVEILRSTFADQDLATIVLNCQLPYVGDANSTAPSGNDIPLAARILGIADAYDAMITEHVYREAISQEQAFAELRRCAGKQFDPELVERLIEVVTARDQNRAGDSPKVSKQTALKIGLQIERLAHLLDSQDISGLAAVASRLKATAEQSEAREIANLANRLCEAANNAPDLKTLIEITGELLQLCRATQRAYLHDRSELLNAASLDADAAAAVPSKELVGAA